MSVVDSVWSPDKNASGGYGSVSNPQILLTVPQGSPEKVTLTLERQTNDAASGLIFHLYKGLGYLQSSPAAEQLVAKSPYYTAHKVSTELQLAAGTYVAVVMQQHSGLRNKFTFETSVGGLQLLHFSGSSSEVTVRNRGKDVGALNNAKNPQFFLTITKPSTCRMELHFEGIPAPCGIKFDVVRASEVKRFVAWPSEKLFASAYQTTTTLAQDLPSPLTPGIYCILPQMQTPAECTVTLKVVLFSDPASTLVAKENADSIPTLKTSSFADLVATLKPMGTTKYSSLTATLYDVQQARRIVDTITQKAKADQVIFEDTSFPHTTALNGRDEDCHGPHQPEVQWQRPSQFLNAPVLFSGGSSVDDIIQGYVGNCWFCSVCTSISTRADICQALFYPSAYNPAGIYCMRFYVNGGWVAIIIDDSLPTRDNKRCFGAGSDLNELWFSLLEKAVAKLMGAYRYLVGSSAPVLNSTDVVLELITGGTAEFLRPAETSDWFEKVSTYVDKKWLVTSATVDQKASVGATTTAGGTVSAEGLVAAHAYTVLRTVDREGTRLLQCRNTWGKMEWKGLWCDGHACWKDAPPSLVKLCAYDPKTAADDGIFWISADDFAQKFSVLHLCRIDADVFPYEKTLDGEWWPGSAVQGFNTISHTQIFLSVERSEATVDIRLVRTDLNGACGMKFCVFDAPEGADQDDVPVFASAADKDAIFTSKYLTSKDLNGVANLPLSGGKKFVVVPFLQAGHPAGCTFRFVVKSTVALLAFKVKAEPHGAAVQSKWTPSTMDGYQGPKNPHFGLTISGNGSVEVKLRITSMQPNGPQGLKVVLAKKVDVSSGAWPKVVAAESPFWTTQQVSLTASLASGDYVVCPTRHKAEEGEFELICTSTCPVRLMPL